MTRVRHRRHGIEALLLGGLSLLVLCGWLAGCASGGPSNVPAAASLEPDPILGVTDREEILEYVPDWVGELVRAEPDIVAAQRLANPAPEVEVNVFFGSWCSDSRRELARLWRALETTGGEAGFRIRYIGVDRAKQEPADLVAGKEILYVPTLIVSRAGTETGRIVESAPGGVEADLADLVAGDVTGWLSGRDDLGSPEAAADLR